MRGHPRVRRNDWSALEVPELGAWAARQAASP